MRSTYLVFGQPMIEQAEIDEVVASLTTAWLGTGPKVAIFERRVAEYMGVRHAVAVNSCTAGLHLACVALGLQSGDEVIVPAMTFCATANAVIHAGATPVLVDVEPDTFNIDIDDVRRKMTGRTKAIIPVHFAGRPCDMPELLRVVRDHDLQMIEDCAHAIEAKYRRATSRVVRNHRRPELLLDQERGHGRRRDGPDQQRRHRSPKIKVMALHGMSADAWKRFSDDGYKHYEVVEVGFKYNMMDLQAAIGMHQIERVESYWDKRLRIWNRYNEALADLPVTLPAPVGSQIRHALHLFTLLVDHRRTGISRDDFIMAMHRLNIGTGVHYRPIPVHPVYQRALRLAARGFPECQQYWRDHRLPALVRPSESR